LPVLTKAFQGPTPAARMRHENLLSCWLRHVGALDDDNVQWPRLVNSRCQPAESEGRTAERSDEDTRRHAIAQGANDAIDRAPRRRGSLVEEDSTQRVVDCSGS
jgi:hypothetical protein